MQSPFLPGQRVFTVHYANLRVTPGYKNKQPHDLLTTLAPDTAVQVIAGPICADELDWWQIDGGYVAESDPADTPLLAPISIAALTQFIAGEAARYALAPHVAQAVFRVEAGPLAVPSARMAVRLEAHVLLDNITNIMTWTRHFTYASASAAYEGHRWRPTPTAPWQPLHKNQRTERAAIDLACKLFPREAVLRSISMGCGQVMGFHHQLLGYDSASSMADAWQHSYYEQVRGFFRFIAARQLVQSLQAGDWTQFAAGYNGAGNVEVYAARLKAAVEAAA